MTQEGNSSSSLNHVFYSLPGDLPSSKKESTQNPTGQSRTLRSTTKKQNVSIKEYFGLEISGKIRQECPVIVLSKSIFAA